MYIGRGVMAVILRYFTEFVYDIIEKQLPRFQNLFLIVYFHILYIILPSVCLYALTLYQATDCSAATDISGVTGCWQLSR